MVNDIYGPKKPPVASFDDRNDDEPVFVPPEVVAQDEELIDMANVEQDKKQLESAETAKKPGKLKTWLRDVKDWWTARGKKQKIMIASGLVLLVALLIVAGFLLLKRPATKQIAAPVVQKTEVKKEPPKPTTEASKLTGLPVSPELNLLPVTGVMIENSAEARPQSGLTEAGIVFEAIAEGGITRFLTLFQESQPDYIGPVRSVRPYYLQWLGGFDAAVAHVGGSPAALAKIRSEGIKDLDQSFNGGSYQRIAEREAPHNVYTSLGNLLLLAKGKGFTTSTFTPLPRKAEKKLALATTKSIDMAISSSLFNVHYDYDPASNNYLRSEGGTPHKDARSGKQISPKVAIAIVVPQGIDPDRVHTSYETIGTGKAYVFQDGGMTIGTWAKASDKQQISFTDASSAPIAINPGQTWITAVGSASLVTFSP